MKRFFIALPLAALLLGLGVYLLRPATQPSSPVPGAPSPAPSAPTAPTAPSPATPSAPAPSAKPAALSGAALRFVVTLNGKPEADVTISAHRTGTDQSMKFKPEADGTQLLREIPPGEWVVSVLHPDAVPFESELSVAPGETALVTAALKTGGKITGTVIDRSGRPVPNTRVLLLDAETKGAISSDRHVTDAEGRYTVPRISPGNYGLRFRSAVHKPLDRLGFVFRGGGEEYRADVTLELGSRYSGRVVDESGMPIADAKVMATNVESGAVEKSGADGTFTLTGLTDVPANIAVSKAGYGRVTRRNIPGNSTNLEFRLPKAGTILGRLEMETYPPQVQVILSRFDDELGQVIPEHSDFFALDTSTGFTFPNVTPGTYWIDVRAEGYEPMERPQIVVAAGQIAREIVISMRKKN